MHVQGRVQGYAGYARAPGPSLQGSPTSFVTSTLEHLGPQLCRHYPTELSKRPKVDLTCTDLGLCCRRYASKHNSSNAEVAGHNSAIPITNSSQ
jgi:hypothetical protein